MARVKRAVNAVKKRRKILKLAKGYFGTKKSNYRIAKQAVIKSLAYSYKGRKLKKRDFRMRTRESAASGTGFSGRETGSCR